MAYTKTNWVNDSAPAINATNLNKIEQGIADNAAVLDGIHGSQSANYRGSYTVGNLTVITGNALANVTSADTNTDVSVSFGETFIFSPNIQLTMLNIGGSYYQKVAAIGISTTGFTVRVRAGNAPGNVYVNWVAIGQINN